MRRILIERGAASERIHLTPNWVDDRELQPDRAASDQLRELLGLPTGRLFMYAGNMGELQCLGPLVEAFGRCPEVNLALVGGGVHRTRLEKLVMDKQLRNVRFVEPQQPDRIGMYLAASDVQIVSLENTRLLRATMPSKMQVAMAASRPILAHAAGDVAEVVVRSRAGLAVRPGDVTGTAKAIRALCRLAPDGLRAMGQSARRHYEKHFSRTAGLARLEQMLTTRVDP